MSFIFLRELFNKGFRPMGHKEVKLSYHWQLPGSAESLDHQAGPQSWGRSKVNHSVTWPAEPTRNLSSQTRIKDESRSLNAALGSTARRASENWSEKLRSSSLCKTSSPGGPSLVIWSLSTAMFNFYACVYFEELHGPWLDSALDSNTPPIKWDLASVKKRFYTHWRHKFAWIISSSDYCCHYSSWCRRLFLIFHKWP